MLDSLVAKVQQKQLEQERIPVIRAFHMETYRINHEYPEIAKDINDLWPEPTAAIEAAVKKLFRDLLALLRKYPEQVTEVRPHEVNEHTMQAALDRLYLC